MTVGNRQYNEAEMLQMQREAEARVREMQNRARRTVEETNTTGAFTPQPRNRNWNSNPNMFRQRRGPQNGRQNRQGPPEPPPPEPEPLPVPEEEAPSGHEAPIPDTPPADAPPDKKSTIVGDIMGALGLDEDYLLIIGLLLILVNQRADTTLILALVYLLL